MRGLQELSDVELKAKLIEAVAELKLGTGPLMCGNEIEFALVASRAAGILREFDGSARQCVGGAVLRSDPDLTPLLLEMFCDRDYEETSAVFADASPRVLEHLKNALGDADHRLSNLAGMLLYQQNPSASLHERGELIGYLSSTAPCPWPSPKPPLRGEPGNLRLFYFSTGPGIAVGPFQDAPAAQSKGGKLYLDAGLDREGLAQALRMLGIDDSAQHNYAVFTAIAEDPLQQQYLVQSRVVTQWMLENMFLARPLSDARPLQHKRTIEEYFWAFLGHQKAVFGDFFGDPRSPHGAFGGDGDYAKEELSFGLMVELPGVYRVWSRAWLVEK
jgi:hypothetical protein